ncbi:MAG: glycine cleavage system protein H, partial [Verrucomicrobia bacterium]|nr:glycine cleavage system protein H [Verrucomicrobiota bacterium]
MSMDDRKYAKSHEWAKMDGAVVVVGISDHAQQELGDITFVELPAVGDTVAAGGEC